MLAACASSLVALHSAIQMMRTGILDAALVGGAEEPLSALHFLEFSVLGALAGLSGQTRPPAEMSRPFDRQRDGFVMGEGAGMIMIERESVARRRGAHIYGYITGAGASNTETGMVESSRYSQIRAIKASFAGLPYGPERVDLVECHATATRQGDIEEVWALKSLYPVDKRTILAGFKSQIGHTLGAAGINSLIRGVMAMNAGIYPATLNYSEPDPDMQLPGSGLVVLTQPTVWPTVSGRPRRFQVDAFGFGGSNYVVQLEQAGDWNKPQYLAINPSDMAPVPTTAWPDGIINLSREIDGKTYRIAVLADTPAAAEQALTESGATQKPAALTEKRRRTLARQGIHITGATASATLPVALVFPGQGSQYVGMGRELSKAFPVVRLWLEQASESFGFDIPRLLFESPEAELRDTRWQQPAVFALEVALAQTLLSFGLRPAALAGHSLGQFAALCIAGVFSFADGCRIVNRRALCMEKAGKLAGDAGSMIAVHAGRDAVEPLLDPAAGVFVLNVNSPTQTVLGGPTEQSLFVMEALSSQGLRCSSLPVGMAFHSPMFQTVQAEFADFLSTIPLQLPAIPVLSNHTQRIFPDDPAEIRRLLAGHMSSPVDWLANVRTLAEEFHIFTFVEAGPREALGNLIRDTLPRAHCIPVCLPSIELPSFRSAVAQLYVDGALPEPGAVREEVLKTASVATAAGKAAGTSAASLATLALQPTDDATLTGVIDVILQTTGYERDEVEPDMDLRDDLAIRSSRLPVIADALESRFGIKLDLQDFAGVRTVRDIAGRISAIRARRNGCPATASTDGARVMAGGGTAFSDSEAPQAAQNAQALRRIIFGADLLPPGEARFLQFSPLDRIGVFCPWGGQSEAAAATEVLRRDHGATIVPVSTPEQAGAGLAGLLLWIGEPPAAADVQQQLTESFRLLQSFLESDQKKAVLLFHRRPATVAASHVLAEGILGMLLCMAWSIKRCCSGPSGLKRTFWPTIPCDRPWTAIFSPSACVAARMDCMSKQAGKRR